MDQDSLEYRRGRLLLPVGIADWPPEKVARWLSRVPLGDRGRAFRALRLNVAAAAFLAMEPRQRVGLLAALNPANIRYLAGIARDDHLLATLQEAGDDVSGALLGALPEWRRSRIEAALAERVVADRGRGEGSSGQKRSWIRRLVDSIKSRR